MTDKIDTTVGAFEMSLDPEMYGDTATSLKLYVRDWDLSGRRMTLAITIGENTRAYVVDWSTFTDKMDELRAHLMSENMDEALAQLLGQNMEE